MSLALDPQATSFVQQLQAKTGPISAELQTALEQAAAPAHQGAPAPAPGQAAPAPKPLSLDQAYDLIKQALPANDYAQSVRKVIDGCKKDAQSYDCGGGKCSFLSQIIDLKIVKERDEVYSPPPTARPALRDPLEASFNMAPNADFMLLFNARDVDRNGQPLLMKIIKRKSADLNNLDLSKYRTAQGWQRDVVEVTDNADVVRIKDTHDDEFNFGDPLKQVSLCGKGRELSMSVMLCRQNELKRNFYYGMAQGAVIVPDVRRTAGQPQVQAGEHLDTQQVVSFEDRIRLKLQAKAAANPAAWLNDAFASYQSTLELDRGLIFEPNAFADVRLGQAAVSTAVPADDAGLIGSPAKSQAVTSGFATIYQLLTSTINLSTYTKNAAGQPKSDARSQNLAVADVIYGLKEHIQVGGADLAPLASQAVTAAELAGRKLAAEKKPLCHDPQKDGQEVKLSLAKGFVAAQSPASVDGWKIMVGYTDEAGQWKTVDTRSVKGCESAAEEFTLQVQDARQIHLQGRQLEVRVYNADGVPAQRLNIGFDQIDWAPGLRGGAGQGHQGQ